MIFSSTFFLSVPVTVEQITTFRAVGAVVFCLCVPFFRVGEIERVGLIFLRRSVPLSSSVT